VVEASRGAMALPCYADEVRDLSGVIDAVLHDHGLTVHPDAREALVGLLGPDRMLTRRELEKLATYAAGQRTVTVEHVEAVMADAKGAELDGVVDAVFLGQVDQLDRSLVRLFAEGSDPGMTLGGALRHAITLHRSRLALDGGAAFEIVERNARVFYKRKGAFQKQLQRWSGPSLEQVIAALREAQAQARRNGTIAETLVSRAFLTIAMRVARAG
jgi:DNA polymerase-3 subunit delta